MLFLFSVALGVFVRFGMRAGSAITGPTFTSGPAQALNR
jgi:hypothetical protein